MEGGGKISLGPSFLEGKKETDLTRKQKRGGRSVLLPRVGALFFTKKKKKGERPDIKGKRGGKTRKLTRMTSSRGRRGESLEKGGRQGVSIEKSEWKWGEMRL